MFLMLGSVARGPIACGVDANPLRAYTTGIVNATGGGIDHVISIVGWGQDAASGQSYWIMRNSWGSYWGEFGYARVAFGALNIEGIGRACMLVGLSLWI